MIFPVDEVGLESHEQYRRQILALLMVGIQPRYTLDLTRDGNHSAFFHAPASDVPVICPDRTTAERRAVRLEATLSSFSDTHFDSL